MSFAGWLRAVCALHHHHPEPPMPELLTDEIRNEAAELAADATARLVRKGLSEDEAIDLVGDILDLLTPIEVLVAGPAGVMLDEAADRAVDAGLHALWAALRRDPEKLRERAKEAQAAGHVKRARKLRARAARSARA